MKQNVVDVLMYLFENIITEENPRFTEHEHMYDRLEDMGFPQHEILMAFDWLETLSELHAKKLATDNPRADISTGSIRIYSELEKLLLDNECIGFLIQLEQSQVITPETRELILDRVIALDVELDLEQLKWIAMIVLYSQPGEENAYAWMENLVFENNMSYIQ